MYAHEHIIIGNAGSKRQTVHYTDEEQRFSSREAAEASAARLSKVVGFTVEVYEAE